MKVFIALSCMLALSVAKPGFLAAPYGYHHVAPALAYAAAPVIAAPAAVSSQYHAQDNLGQYNYGYADHLSSKAEVRSFDGVTRGSYSYVDAEGKIQKVDYTADDVHGFRVAATNLPVAPVAPAVPAVPAVPEPAMLEQPKPVEDTPEVAKAKEEHFAAVEEVKARNAAESHFEVAAPVNYVAPVATYAAAPVTTYAAAPLTTYAAAPLTTYAAAPAHYAYSHGAYPYYNYSPYSNFGYHYTAAAPVYSGYQPFHFAAPAVPVAAAPVSSDAVVTDEDTVEVKAKEE